MILTLLTTIYLIIALILALYTTGQLILLVQYWRHRKQTNPVPEVNDWPQVTVQLPLYNERHVVTRLLDAVAALDYPRDRLLIQVLDDSTDETSQITARHVAYLMAKGFRILHIQRTNRTGYKAGALHYGLSHVAGDIIALFDADFVPPPDFLKRTVPYMVADPTLGIVQTRWGHLNAYENGLTLAQTLSIDVHFLIEQAARNRSGWTLSFNGTGGLWRRSCIEAAGGWSDETLTEDLDLSYRAQLAGWRYLMLPDVVVPGEVPPQLAAYKQQQSRWAKGSTQSLGKLIAPLWNSSLPLMTRIMGTHNLCQYVPHPLMLILLILTPILLIGGQMSKLPLAPLGIVGLIPPVLYVVSQRALYPDWKSRLTAFPIVMLLGAGITWNNTWAVMSVLIGRGGGFKRTPKFGQTWHNSTYALRGDWTLWGEVLLAIYSIGSAGIAMTLAPALVPYLSLYAAAFSLMSLWGLYDVWQVRRIHAIHGKRKPDPVSRQT